MKTRLSFAFVLALGFSLAGLFAPTAEAASPGLQLNPLKYEDTLLGSAVRGGYIDVSNPSDTKINIEAEVKGFKQVDLDGNLTFFPDNSIKEGIKLGLERFELGPREAVRVSFSVNPAKLPKGGVYAAVFFRTIPPQQQSNTSFVAESANVGTLLLLQNGPAGQHIGQITRFKMPLFQFGAGLRGSGEYRNNDRTKAPIAFAPDLQARVFPWGRTVTMKGPYVLPGSTRRFELNRSGSFFGFIPVSLIDKASGQGPTRWVFACTGWYAYVFILGLLLLTAIAAFRMTRSNLRVSAPAGPDAPVAGIAPASRHRALGARLLKLRHRLRRIFRRKQAPARRPMDGLSRKRD